jgi:hypothetical protein
LKEKPVLLISKNWCKENKNFGIMHTFLNCFKKLLFLSPQFPIYNIIV